MSGGTSSTNLVRALFLCSTGQNMTETGSGKQTCSSYQTDFQTDVGWRLWLYSSQTRSHIEARARTVVWGAPAGLGAAVTGSIS